MKPAPPVTRYEAMILARLLSRDLSNADAIAKVAADYVQTRGSGFAQLRRVLLIIIAAIVLCSLIGWLLLHVGVEVVQALIAVAMMTITWQLLRRRPGMSIADEFRNW